MPFVFGGLIFLGFGLVIFLGRIFVLIDPYAINVDDSTYLALTEIISQGGTLYLDAADRKPPGFYFFYWLITQITGPWNLFGVQIIFILLTLLASYLAYLIAYRVTSSRKQALFSAGFYAFFSACFPRSIVSANAEVPMLVCTLLFFYFLVLGTKDKQIKPWLSFILASFFAILSTLFKQYSVLIVGPILLVWAYSLIKNNDSRFLVYSYFKIITVGMFLSTAVLYAIVVGYFYYHGALKDFLFYAVTDGLKFVKESRVIENQNENVSLLRSIIGMLISWSPAWMGCFLLFKDRAKLTWIHGAFFAGLLGSIATALLSGRYYSHYFIPCIWFVCVLGALGLSSYVKSSRGWRLTIVVITIITFSVYLFVNIRTDLIQPNASFNSGVIKKMSAASEWISQNSLETDRIVVWGMATQIYVMSKRGSGSRFVFADYVSGRQPGYNSPVILPVDGAEDDLVEDLQENRPLYLVDTHPAEINDYQYFPMENYPTLFSFIKSHYKKVEMIEGISIWKRRD